MTQTESQPTRLLAIAEAAQRLGIHHRTLRRIVAEGRIQVVRPSPRRVMISESAIEDYIEARTEKVTA
jgi:excisionase family DNA binding protein